MMTGGTLGHNRITRNAAGALEGRLRAGCEVFTSDVKVVSPAGETMYPALVVSCGEMPDRATVEEEVTGR